MKISVIIPSYKPQEYLWTCLDSLRRQTLAPSQYEVLLVLNGCCEPYKSAISSYAYEHRMDNLRLMHTDTAGVSNARNIALDSARGEYIAFIDDDDYVSDTYLETLLRSAADGVTPVCNLVAFDDATGRELPYYVTDRYRALQGRGAVSLFQARSYLSLSVAKLVPRDVIGSRRYDTRFVMNEDALFMFAVSRHMRSMQATSPDAVYYRRVRETSVSMRRRSRRDMLLILLRLSWAFTVIYAKGFPRYSTPLYMSRVFMMMVKSVRLFTYMPRHLR